MRRRKSLAVVELISKGPPRNLLAGPGSVYVLSTTAKKVVELKENQIGVKRVLSEVNVARADSAASALRDPGLASLVAEHVNSAIKTTVRETEERLSAQSLAFTLSKDWDALVALNDARTIRVLMDTFFKCHLAKRLLRELRASVNQIYVENSIPGVVSDLLSETKNILVLKASVPSATAKLLLIEEAIDRNLSSPSGQGFVQLMTAYLNANRLIHEALSKEELAAIGKEISDGKSFHLKKEGREWLMYMAGELLKST